MPADKTPIKYNVQGRVYNESGQSIANAIVYLFERNLRSEKEMGKSVTNNEGKYNIGFTRDMLTSAEHKRADVYIKCLDASGKEIGRSQVYFNISEDTTIDLKLVEEAFNALSEYEKLNFILLPLLKANDVLPEDLKQSKDVNEIEFLSKDTNEPEEHIRFYSLAHLWQNKNKIDAEFFYGLLRMGVPEKWEEILKIKSSVISEAIDKALEENIISSDWKDKKAKYIGILNAMASEENLNSDGSPSPTAKILGKVIEKDKQQLFLETLYTHEEDPKEFWKAVETNSNLGPKVAEETKKLFYLEQLTGSQPELTMLLFDRQNSDTDLAKPSGFAKFTKENWEEHIKRSNIKDFPAFVKGDNTDEKLKNYAEQLERFHSQAFPAAKLAFQMKADANNQMPFKEEVTGFLIKNPQIDLKTNNLKEELDQADFSGTMHKEKVVEQLKIVNRLNKLTDNVALIGSFQAKGLTSAVAIEGKYSQEAFRNEFSGVLGGIDQADQTYHSIVSVSNKVQAVALSYKSSHDISLYALNGSVDVPADYISMFGPRQTCKSKDCETVYSPAAYYTDLLKSLKDLNPNADSNGDHSFESLIQKRPDLVHILLNCKNTNTPLPYIDLVNELLEDRIMNNDGSDLKGNQTLGSAESLLQWPEHVNPAAYGQIQLNEQTVFKPEVSPDLHWKETGLYLEKLGIDRSELFEVFGVGDKVYQNHVSVGLSPQNMEDVNAIHNFNLTAGLGNIQELLDETGLDFNTLIKLLDTNFLREINGNPVRIEPESLRTLDCDLTKAKIENIDEYWLKKVAVFLRVLDKSRLSIIQLDKALTGMDSIDGNAIDRIAQLKRLALEMEISFDEALEFLEPNSWQPVLTRRLGLQIADLDQLTADGILRATPSIKDFIRLTKFHKLLRQHNLSLTTIKDIIVRKKGDLMKFDFEKINPVSSKSTIKNLEEYIDSLTSNLSLHGEKKIVADRKAYDNFINELKGNDGITNGLNAAGDLLIEDVAMREHIKQLQNINDVSLIDNNYLKNLKSSFERYKESKKRPIILEKIGFNDEEANLIERFKDKLKINLLWNETVNADTYGHFIQLLSFRQLLSKAKDGEDWKALLSTLDSGNKEDWAREFGRLFLISDNVLKALIGDNSVNGILKLTFTDTHLIENLWSLFEASKLYKEINTDEVTFQSILSKNPTANDADQIRQHLKSRYSPLQWTDIIKPISDKLRVFRREAMLTWLTANNVNGWKSPEDVYAALLIDPLMESCMVTSRLKQAISSVQLFIERCILGLESYGSSGRISLSEEFIKQWNEWRERYRIWEANRKVFLYPENWLEPELRDDKSPFFEELESQLKQVEVNDETATDALMDYLYKLDTISRPEYVGICKDELTDTMYLLARTPNLPHKYYFRTLKDKIYSAWYRIDQDIEGDHVLPVIWNGRFMIFWAQFEEKQQQNSVTGTLSEIVIDTPTKYWTIKLAWTEYKKGKWSSKKVSKEFLDTLSGGGLYRDPKHMKINANYKESGSLDINVFMRTLRVDYDNHYVVKLGTFLFNNFNSQPFIDSTELQTFDIILLPDNTHLENNQIAHNEDDNLFLLNDKGLWRWAFFSSEYHYKVLSKAYSFKLINKSDNTEGVTFYYSDSSNSFYVQQVKTIRTLPSFENLPPVPRRNHQLFKTLTHGGFQNKTERNNINLQPTTELIYGKLPIPVTPTSVFGGILEYVEEEIISPFAPRYNFQLAWYPFVCEYINALASRGIEVLFEFGSEDTSQIIFSRESYDPTGYVNRPYPIKQIEFGIKQSYSLYNWELFFHIPLLIATRLHQNQKYADARKWFHFVFNPTKEKSEPTEGTERFWITKPFKDELRNGNKTILQLLTDSNYVSELNAQLSVWENDPFNPHAIARMRISTYMRNTMMRYIDNLIEWGDHLFRQDTIETINEATLLYIMASNLLGPRPEEIDSGASRTDDISFDEIESKLDKFSNAIVEVESVISPSSSSTVPLKMLYFSIPANDHILQYWDKVGDRLFKIRNCMNIEGIVRQLPLFEPPIDPALLVRAKAAGLDISEVVTNINVGLPSYRFQYMLAKANELCGDVKNLGNSLLSAIEKKDSEALTLLRTGHEQKLQEKIRLLKEHQKEEAKTNLDSLNASKKVVEERMNYYGSREFINSWEAVYFLSSNLGLAFQTASSSANVLAASAHTAPDVKVGSPFTAGLIYGGSSIGQAAEASAENLRGLSLMNSAIGSIANMMGNYKRRMDDWNFQAKTAELELKQLDKQILAAEIRLSIAEKDLENHDLQMEQSQEIKDYFYSKFSGNQLYDWMISQVSSVYFSSYQLAQEAAKQAERCMQHELGIESSNHIQPATWDSLKKGLMAGELLQLDLRNLEKAYMEANKREYEITKHISLAQIDPLKLAKLRQTGACEFDIPEIVYDMDFPGQYLRRIKSVSVSLPCIAGPYTSVSAKLSLVSAKYRKRTTVTNAEEDFVKHHGPVQSVATSHGQNDSGVFELNFRDERYLPFEGIGAISNWNLELPEKVRQFDYGTISDVILHVKYTARDGGQEFKESVNTQLTEELENIKLFLDENAEGIEVLMSMKGDFNREWTQLKETRSTTLKIGSERLPYLIKPFMQSTPRIQEVTIVPAVKDYRNLDQDPNIEGVEIGGKPIVFEKDASEPWNSKIPEFELNIGQSVEIPSDTIKLLEDLYLIVKYKK